MPSSESRIQQWASLLNHVGDDWRKFVPVDAKVHGEDIHLDGYRLSRTDQGRWSWVAE